MRVSKWLMAGVAAAMSLSITGAHAAGPAHGSLLLTSFCSSPQTIKGAGSTLANAAMNGVFIPAYNSRCPAGSGKVSYPQTTNTGSGAGRALACNRNSGYAWGGTDDPLDPIEIATFGAGSGNPTESQPCGSPAAGAPSPVHQIPVALAAIQVSVNLGSCGVGANQLKLTSRDITLMYSGVITSWSDSLLTHAGMDNAVLAHCNKPVKLVARSDSSGTTFAFKDYLSKRNPVFMAYKQSNVNTQWPASDAGTAAILRASGNGGVADLIKATDGAIGYNDLATARSRALTAAEIDNPTGTFVAPSEAGCAAAGTQLSTPASTLSPGWDAVTITDDPLGYPDCTLTYALVYNNLHSAYPTWNQATAQTLVDFFAVALDPATQAQLPTQQYAPLPAAVQQIAWNGLATINFN